GGKQLTARYGKARRLQLPSDDLLNLVSRGRCIHAGAKSHFGQGLLYLFRTVAKLVNAQGIALQPGYAGFQFVIPCIVAKEPGCQTDNYIKKQQNQQQGNSRPDYLCMSG